MAPQKQAQPPDNAGTQNAPFLNRIPLEIRDKIFSYVFRNTRLGVGMRHIDNFKQIRIKSDPNALALLRTCRRTYAEIGNKWISLILFHYEDPETMVNRLLSAPPGTIQRIRRLRVVGDPLQIKFYKKDEPENARLHEACPRCVFYQLPSVLKLLPGLGLDTLTILGPRSPAIGYCTLTTLIAESDGWKELRFITHSSSLLGFVRPIGTHLLSPQLMQLLAHKRFFSTLDVREYAAVFYVRSPQPMTWRAVLSRRDGEATRPEVDVYRSVVAESPGSVIDPGRRVLYEQEFQPAVIIPEEYADDDNLTEHDFALFDGFGRHSEKDLMCEGEKRKEMMVVVRRGSGVDYEEKRNSPFIVSDIRRDCWGESWEQIRRERIEKPAAQLYHYRRSIYENNYGYEDPRKGDVTEPVVGSEVDAYNDAEEIVWPPRHFDAPPTFSPWQLEELRTNRIMVNIPSFQRDEEW